jgi:sugar phosphate isomerase/epimerase
MDRLLLATYSLTDLASYRRAAEQWQCGIELHTFVDPKVLSNDLSETISHHQKLLDGFGGLLGFHGAFYDLVSGSRDPEIVAITERRYRQNLEIAAALKGDYVVFHSNYMGGFKLSNYRAGWHRRQVKFWRSLVREAADYGIHVLLENMWADDPTIIAEILHEVDHPNLLACLDIAHTVLFSSYAITSWIDALQPYLYCCHLNNTDGLTDLHWPLGHGIIDYAPILAYLRALPEPPLLTLEMASWDTIVESLPFFESGFSDLPAP